MNYTFSVLNDREFEILANDLWAVSLGRTTERFKPWKDSGIDGRFIDHDKWVITIMQAKHMLKTGYKGMKRQLEKGEVEKVRKLSLDSYVFITSLPLSPWNKKEIYEIFKPYIKSESDILGQEDLNDLLFKFPEIEKRHFKLLISSSTALVSLLNQAIEGRSKFELESMRSKSHSYTETSDLRKAIKILEDEGVIIITGEPWIGKTTLAENLCLRLIAEKGYTLMSIEENISEAESVFLPEKKIIFYYDDFLGRNYLEAIEGKKDSHIVKFIERIQKDKSKLFILTSRTTILNNSIQYSHIFSNENIRKNEFTLEVSQLLQLDKARILYSHMQHSSLSTEYIDVLYQHKQYLKIIQHKNFNPRLIAFITDASKVRGDPNIYWNYIESTLNNPKDIWRDSFKIQNDHFVRAVVLLVVFSEWNILEKELKIAFERLKKIDIDLKSAGNIEKDFNSSTRLATKSFLNRTSTERGIQYTLFNPSISDFVFHEYANEIEKMVNIQKALESHKCLHQLTSLSSRGFISKDVFIKIIEQLFDDAIHKVDCDIDYIIWLSKELPRGDSKRSIKINSFLLETIQKIELEEVDITEIFNFIHVLNCHFYWDQSLENLDFLYVLLEDKSLNESDIEAVWDLMSESNTFDSWILKLLKGQIGRILEDWLYYRLEEIDLDEVIEFEKSEDWTVSHYWDDRKVGKGLEIIANSILDDFPHDLLNKLNFSPDKTIQKINTDDLISKHVRNHNRWYEDRDFDDVLDYKVDSMQEIEDLFSRG